MRHEPAPRQQPLRPPRRPALRASDRGRVLRGPAASAPPRRAAPRPSAATSTSAPRATRSSSTRSSGTRPARRTGRSPCAARTASGTTVGVYEQDDVERFDEELDRGTEALVRDLKRLMRANMEDEIERFVAARSTPTPSSPRLLGRSGVPVDDRRRPRAPAPRAGRSGSAGSSAFASRPSPSASPARVVQRAVAAIASHTASACSGVAHRAQVERRQLGVALAGEDERQRDRAVEQVGAAVLAGPLRRARRRRARRRAAGRPGRSGGRSRPARRPGRRPRARRARTRPRTAARS